MNRIYRKVWNKALGQLVVASELASSDSSSGAVVDQRRDATQATPALLAVALGLVVGLGMSGTAAAQCAAAAARTFSIVRLAQYLPYMALRTVL